MLMVLALAGAGAWWSFNGVVQGGADYRSVRVERRAFQQILRRYGVLKPVNEQHILCKLNGTILEMAEQGKVVAKDEIIMKLDPMPQDDAKVAQEAAIAQQQCEFKKLQQDAAKVLNQAKEDVEGYNLILELESGRLTEIKRGPTAIDEVTAEVVVETSKILANASEEEVGVLQGLSAGGFVSREELRQKKLDMTQQKLKVVDAEIGLRKVQRVDPVKLATQELKVKDAIKTRDGAKERVVLLERNLQRDAERYARHMEHEKTLLNNALENIGKAVIRAPGPGVVVHKRHRWYTLVPGSFVYDGMEVMAIPDFSKMKVVLAVDEGRIANVCVDQRARIIPAGWSGEPFQGKVIKVADKGHDEFEMFLDDTTAISGTANRQVFDVEVEIEGEATVLRPGLRAAVEIVLKDIDKAIVVPRAALEQEQDNGAVVRVDLGGDVERRQIKVVAENEFCAAVEGVKLGEQVRVVKE